MYYTLLTNIRLNNTINASSFDTQWISHVVSLFSNPITLVEMNKIIKIADYAHSGNLRSGITVRHILRIEFSRRWLLKL